MNNQEIKGKIEKAKGKLRVGLANLTGDEKEQRKGKIEQIKGNVDETIGKIKRKAKRLLE